jgi:uncharacterized SAM-binding protein YcdF (DUF218 family)
MIRWLIGGVLVALGLIACLTFFLEPNSFIGCGDTPSGNGNCRKADAIVAVSGGDTRARASEAIKLYKNGWADDLVFSGAAQDKSGPSNAAAMAAQAEAEGVPDSAIQLDESSATTAENASNSQTIFEKNHYHTVILVTSGYHQRRASLEFTKLAKGTIILNHPTDDKDWTMWWWVTPRGWWLAGSELVKIIIFFFQGIQL